MRPTRWLLLLAPLTAVLLAAAPTAGVSADECIRNGNLAVASGAYKQAEECYAAAEDATADPGLVAFNKATALFHQNKFPESERCYTRALDDADAPPARRAAALYNRGVCLLKQGGLQKLRTAIDSFDRCLALKPDDALAADARHNLELAKLLWADARAKEATRPTPNDQQPEAPPEPKHDPPTPQKHDDRFGQDPLTADGGQQPLGKPDSIRGSPGGTPRETSQQAGGHGDARVIKDGDRLPDMPPDKVREYLEALTVRVAKERRATAALTAPPERPSVKDW